MQRRRGRLSPGRADRHPLLLPRAATPTCAPTSRARSTCSRRRRDVGRRAGRAHLHQRGLRHGAATCRSTRSTRCRAQSPYSASKIGADKMAEAFHRSFGLPVVTVRPFNTYGPRQSARAVIPTIITQCLHGARRIRLGNLRPTRDLNYVANTVDGFLWPRRRRTTPSGETINLGVGTRDQHRRPRRNCIAADGRDDPIEVRARSGACGRQRARSSACWPTTRSARELLGWEPRVDLEEGLRRTIDWMREHLHALPARCLRHLNRCSRRRTVDPAERARDPRQRVEVRQGVPRHQLGVVGRAVRRPLRAGSWPTAWRAARRGHGQRHRRAARRAAAWPASSRTTRCSSPT